MQMSLINSKNMYFFENVRKNCCELLFFIFSEIKIKLDTMSKFFQSK